MHNYHLSLIVIIFSISFIKRVIFFWINRALRNWLKTGLTDSCHLIQIWLRFSKILIFQTFFGKNDPHIQSEQKNCQQTDINCGTLQLSSQFLLSKLLFLNFAKN
jgi:hypothetical protein